MLEQWIVTAQPINIDTKMPLFTDCVCAACQEDRAAGGTLRQASALGLVGLGEDQETRCLYLRVKDSLEVDLMAREKSMNPR